jgi:hypothetical protein
MSRPVGVTASAIVAILGSIFALLTSALMVASLFMGTTQPQPPNSAKLAFASAVMFAALAGFGIWTSVGLFRLRSWARVSILVFAVFLVAMCALSLLLTMAAPIPAEYSGSTEHTFRVMMAAMFGIPLAIAVWWLIQFNTQSTKAAFASPIAGAPSRRPMSIMVIAWTLIIGAVFCLIPILIRMPAFLFGATFTGWSASVIYALFGALWLYTGKGLLDLRERARVLAIGWFGFGLVHASVVVLVPSLRERMFELQRQFEKNQPTPIPFDRGTMTSVTFAAAALVGGITIWFLVRNRPAFVQTTEFKG